MKIGIFDSGIGGLTVAKEIIEAVPNADIVYVGDTARVPYGPRSKQTIIAYAKEIVIFLMKQKVDIIVVACNTVSSVAIKEVKKIAGKIPIIDMIGPVVEDALKVTKNKKIAIIGTVATINSHAYKKALEKANKSIRVYEKACPLFVPFVEEGLGNDKLAKPVVKYYLNNKSIDGVDTMILGCTHYPLIEKNIRKILGDKVKLVSCGKPAADKVKELAQGIPKLNRKSILKFYVTDDPEKSQKTTHKFFGKFINIKKIKL